MGACAGKSEKNVACRHFSRSCLQSVPLCSRCGERETELSLKEACEISSIKCPPLCPLTPSRMPSQSPILIPATIVPKCGADDKEMKTIDGGMHNLLLEPQLQNSVRQSPFFFATTRLIFLAETKQVITGIQRWIVARSLPVQYPC